MKCSRLISIGLVATFCLGCSSLRREQLSQKLRIQTQPKNASVSLKDEAGKLIQGTGPLEWELEYEQSYYSYNKWIWLAPALSAVATMVGFGLMLTGEDIDTRSTGEAVGVILPSIGGLLTLLGTLPICIVRQVQADKPYGFSRNRYELEISKDGYELLQESISLPLSEPLLSLELNKASTPEPARQSVAFKRKTPPRAPDSVQGTVVAVFLLEDGSRVLQEGESESLTDYLGTLLAQSGRFQIIPRDQMRKRLLEQKKDSYKACYSASCQIELGKALAAEKSLATKVLKVGERCAMTASLYDLKKETVEKAASSTGGCASEALLAAMQEIAAQLAAP